MLQLKNMKIAVWPSIDDACAEYRLIQPARVLKNQGFDVFVDSEGARVYWDNSPNIGDLPTINQNIINIDAYEADVVVLQRPSHRATYQIIPFLQKQGIKVIVDVDDRYDKIHPLNQAYDFFQPSRDPANNYEWVFKSCQIADAVTATTPDLIRVYGFGHGYVIPNYVPESYFSIETEKHEGSIGWAGIVRTHPTDLQVVGSAVENACNATGAHFRVVGLDEGVQDALKLSQPVEATGWISRSEYITEMGKLEIGIVPLADTVFNKSKSALKMMEFASKGVPVIGSATPDNVRLNKLGVGLIANTPQKWLKYLKSLAKNKDRREDIAGASFEAMKLQTYEKNIDKWAKVWMGE